MTSRSDSPPPAPSAPDDESPAGDPPGSKTLALWRAGRTAWATLGVLALVAVLGFLASELSFIVVPVVLALFPATLLWPVASWLKKHRFPTALASLAAILAGLLLFAALIGSMVPLVVAEMPQLMQSAADGVRRLEEWLAREPFGVEVGGISELLAAAQDQIGEIGDIAPRALAAATTAVETIAGILLLFVVLFFYLKDGPRLSAGIVSVLPAGIQDRVRGAFSRAWILLGTYFRWLLVVALVDAVLIGVGLLILQVPLAIPLAVLVFFGGLFPIVGAVATGGLAVLVALADGGFWLGVAVLGLVLVVQQLESNVLHPIVQGRAIKLHPLLVLLAVTAGGLLLGILGAFLAVPVAAITAGTLRYLTGRNADGRADAGGAKNAGESQPGEASPKGGEGGNRNKREPNAPGQGASGGESSEESSEESPEGAPDKPEKSFKKR